MRDRCWNGGMERGFPRRVGGLSSFGLSTHVEAERLDPGESDSSGRNGVATRAQGRRLGLEQHKSVRTVPNGGEYTRMRAGTTHSVHGRNERYDPE